jgi:hypothetical protein
MGSYRARQMRAVRVAQFGAMHPVDLADAIRLVRRVQIEMLRRDVDRQQRSANDNDVPPVSRGVALLGELMAALGYEAEQDHPLEIAAGLGAAAYRCFVGIHQ